jgi:NAD(P)-dependent dehydrogenase (short-subunit alcohol dehydrogenase family)
MNKKTALVTGASRGIGRAIALRLAKDGYHVLVHYVSNREKAESLVDEIYAAGGTAQTLQADLCDLSQTEALAANLPAVDILVLNASVQFRTPWQQIPMAEALTQLNCNLLSSLRLIQAVSGHMQRQKWGRIITIGSVQEAKPHPDMLIYSASKAAQENMVRSLSLQLAPFGITVNNVAPGVIATDRNVQALSDAEYAQKVRDSIPAGFYGQPEDCAGIVSLLCSGDGRYITGQSIFVDGGKSIQ